MTPQAADIRPVVDTKSDFYSWQLFRWVRRYPELTAIYSGMGQLYIGKINVDGSFFGADLRYMCHWNKPLSKMNMPEPIAKHFEDITEEFWDSYSKKGVCAIHRGSAHNWEYDEDGFIRTCKYCQEKQRMISIVKTDIVWRKV